jgi:hypothetical protein
MIGSPVELSQMHVGVRDRTLSASAAMKAPVVLATFLLLTSCATNCNTVLGSKVWTPVDSELAVVRDANEVAANAGLVHHTMAYGPVTWYRRSNGDLYRCERIEVGAILSGNPDDCMAMGVYLTQTGSSWDPHLGVTSKCQ